MYLDINTATAANPLSLNTTSVLTLFHYSFEVFGIMNMHIMIMKIRVGSYLGTQSFHNSGPCSIKCVRKIIASRLHRLHAGAISLMNCFSNVTCLCIDFFIIK